MESILLPIYCSSANLIKSATGSLPADKTKIRGVMIELSLKHLGKSNVGTIMNYFPIISEI